jgi:hypothetical protein
MERKERAWEKSKALNKERRREKEDRRKEGKKQGFFSPINLSLTSTPVAAASASSPAAQRWEISARDRVRGMVVGSREKARSEKEGMDEDT